VRTKGEYRGACTGHVQGCVQGYVQRVCTEGVHRGCVQGHIFKGCTGRCVWGAVSRDGHLFTISS
jgi:hypothetical protein